MENTKKRPVIFRSLRIFQRFQPYFRPYLGVLLLDLFCATLTTVCDLVLPLIVRFITSAATSSAAVLTICVVLRLGAVYLLLRVVDTAAY